MEQTAREIDLSATSILPALKTFPSNEVAIIGCHSLNLARQSCEYDLLIVNQDPIPQKFIKVGELYARLIFRSERDIRQPDPELALTLASAVPLRDSSFLLASAASDCKRSFTANCQKGMEARLASSLKSLARVDEMLSKKETGEADFCLLSAARDFAYAWLLQNGLIPAPSHLLTQIKSLPKKRLAGFKLWSDAFGLELASRFSCENRLDGLEVIYDVIRTSSSGLETDSHVGHYRDVEAVRVLKMKSEELLDSMRSTECFTYLGHEVVQGLLDLYVMHVSKLYKERDYSRIVRDLTVGGDRLISEDVVKSLGLVRSPEMLASATAGLKSAVSSLAKKV